MRFIFAGISQHLYLRRCVIAVAPPASLHEEENDEDEDEHEDDVGVLRQLRRLHLHTSVMVRGISCIACICAPC